MANIDDVRRKLEQNHISAPDPAEQEPSSGNNPEKFGATGGARNQRSGFGATGDGARNQRSELGVTGDGTENERSGFDATGGRHRNENSVSGITPTEGNFPHGAATPEKQRGLTSEQNSGVFDNRRPGTATSRPPQPRPYRPPSRFWDDFTDGLPTLWGIDFALILISVAGLGWILFHFPLVTASLAGMVYGIISSALTPLFDILFFLLALGLIAAALRRMCAPRGCC